MRLYEAATAYIEFESMFDRNNVSIGRATAGTAPGDGRMVAYGQPGKPAFTRRKTRESIRAIVVLILIAAVCGIVRAQQSAASPASKPPVEQMVPMRDGVKLATAVYLPEGHGPWAVVLIRNLQFPGLINSSGRIPENSSDITESNFCTILQLSISNRNAIDLCPIFC